MAFNIADANQSAVKALQNLSQQTEEATETARALAQTAAQYRDDKNKLQTLVKRLAEALTEDEDRLKKFNTDKGSYIELLEKYKMDIDKITKEDIKNLIDKLKEITDILNDDIGARKKVIEDANTTLNALNTTPDQSPPTPPAQPTPLAQPTPPAQSPAQPSSPAQPAPSMRPISQPLRKPDTVPPALRGGRKKSKKSRKSRKTRKTRRR